MNRNVIITGGSRGIGRATAEAFLQDGDRVLIIARTKAEFDQVKALQADVSSQSDVEKIRSFIEREWQGKVDVLVNAAGILGPIGPLESLSDEAMEQWLAVFRVNVLGTALMCRMATPLMKRGGGGRIINFSGGGEEGWANFTAYTASKGAILRLTESLAEEVAPHKIWVNVIAPGTVKTKMLENVIASGLEKVGKEDYERITKQVGEGLATPEKAVTLILFLCSPDADGITGKFFSAVWDDPAWISDHKTEIINSDLYTARRLTPHKDQREP